MEKFESAQVRPTSIVPPGAVDPCTAGKMRQRRRQNRAGGGTDENRSLHITQRPDIRGAARRRARDNPFLAAGSRPLKLGNGKG